MSQKIYLVAYTTTEKEVKSATVYSHTSFGILGPKALEFYSGLVKAKNNDEVEYILNIQCLGDFHDPQNEQFPY
jgi:hypothetical protein